jgi:hypothetical protein
MYLSAPVLEFAAAAELGARMLVLTSSMCSIFDTEKRKNVNRRVLYTHPSMREWGIVLSKRHQKCQI